MNLFRTPLTRRESVVLLTELIVSLLLLLAVFACLDAVATRMFLNSDTFYQPALYKDLVLEKQSLQRWHLNPAPNFFPDMPLYFLLMWLSQGKLLIASFAFGVIQYLLILFLLHGLQKRLLPSQPLRHGNVLFLVFCLLGLESLFGTKDLTLIFYMLVNSYHCGAFVMSLIGLLISFRYLEQGGWRSLAGLFVISAATALSDRLFLMLFVVPLCGSLVLLCRRTGVRKVVGLMSPVLLGAGLGLFLFNRLPVWGVCIIDSAHHLLSAELIRFSFDMLLDQLRIYLSEIGFKSLCFYLFIISLVCQIVLLPAALRRRDKPLLGFYMVFALLFALGVFVAPVLAGNYSGFDALRYNIYPLYLMPLNIILMGWLITDGREKTEGLRRVLQPAAWCGLCLIAVMALWRLQSGNLSAYFNFYPERVKLLDSLVLKENLHCGVANYWNAKYMNLLSKKNLRITAVFDELAYWDHVSNDAKFDVPGTVFDYVITTGFEDTSAYRQKVNVERVLLDSAGFRVVKTKPFIYDLHIGFLPVKLE